MRKEEKERAILMEIFRELYLAATPPANFDELPYLDKNSKFFDDYTLDQDVADEIINRILKKYRVAPKHKQDSFRTTVYLSCSPRFNYKPYESNNN